MEDKLPKCLTGFRNSHRAQRLFVTMLGKWNVECVSALFVDLSKAFDAINHDLLLVKLKAYRFPLNALKLMHSDLINRKQQVLISNISSLKAVLLLSFCEAL